MKRITYSLLAVITIACLFACGGGADVANNPKSNLLKSELLQTTLIDGFDDYEIEVREVRGAELIFCNVVFFSLPEATDTAAKVVHNAISQAVKKNPDREILATGFRVSGDVVPSRMYNGHLVYDPADGKIISMRERSGLKTTQADEGSYFAEIRDEEITISKKKWYEVSIIFKRKPHATEIKAAVISQIDKLQVQELDIDLYIYTGDSENFMTWKHVKAPNGKYMNVKYVSSSGDVSPSWAWEPKYTSRTWTDATGEFSVQAVFISYTNGQVTIRRDDTGELKTIPLDDLSEDCQLYFQSLRD